jgi:phage shock protein C
MQISPNNLLFRGDTFLGVCEGLGEDFGFNPLYLRAVLGIGLIWNPLAVIGTYFGLGLLVAFSRLVAPNPRPAFARASASEPAPPQEAPQAGNDEERMLVAA